MQSTHWRALEAQNTFIPRVSQCLSPRTNWDPRTPSPASECPSPREPKGGGTLSCRWGGGGSQFERLEKKPSTNLRLEGYPSKRTIGWCPNFFTVVLFRTFHSPTRWLRQQQLLPLFPLAWGWTQIIREQKTWYSSLSLFYCYPVEGGDT